MGGSIEPPMVGRSYSAVGGVGGWSRTYAVATVPLSTPGPLGQWQTSRGCLRFLRWEHAEPLSESWVASPLRGWNRAYSGSCAA